MMKFIILLSVLSFAVNIVSAQNNLPRLKEATEVEAMTNQITVRAKGLGIDDADDIMTDAENDAKKAAVYFVLYQNKTPLLQTSEERKLFSGIENSFFDIDNIGKFILNTGTSFLSRIKTKSGIKVEKQIRVDTQALENYLVDNGIKKETDDLASMLDNPDIFVIPDKPLEEALKMLRNDDDYKQGLIKIQEFFESRSINIKYAEQSDIISKGKKVFEAFNLDTQDDPVKLIAEQLQCDIYLKYNIYFENIADGKKAVVNCVILKTSTSDVLASKTGHSQFRPYASNKALIEEAINQALDDATRMLITSWKKELKKGNNYLLSIVFNNYTEINTYEAGDYLYKILGELTNDFKEIIATDQKIDFEVYLDPNEFKNYRPFCNKVKEEYNKGVYGRLTEIKPAKNMIFMTIE